MPSVTTCSADETSALGARLGRLLQPGDFIALTGELGAGKTQFARGVARGLDVDPALPVTSPTYTLMNVLPGRVVLYHFDLYRLSGDDDAAELGFAEYFHGRGVCIVEWAERLALELPGELLTVHFQHGGDDTRRIEFTALGPRYLELMQFFARSEKML
jgi:tRNA threonylcarbamoyladenosine biosynthesis protein TsaE